jgi:hypothetical protein
VAIKKKLVSRKLPHPILEHEFRVPKTLAGHEIIPNVKVYDRHENFNILVMHLLRPSLRDQFRDCDKRFSMTTARLGLVVVGLLSLLLFQQM